MIMLVFVFLLTLVFFASPTFAALEVSECGARVPENETAHLVADLDCSESGAEGVVLADGARLLLGGYSIVSDPAENDRRPGVRCRTGSVCSVVGPGEISGFSASGIAGTRVRVRDVVVSGNAVAGIIAYENIHLDNVVVDGNGVVGVHAGGKISGKWHDMRWKSAFESAGFIETRAPRFRPKRRSCSADSNDS